MADQGHPDHQLKRIVLPSGKTIEVVYFEHPAAAPPASAPGPDVAAVEAPSSDRLLHICPDCESSLVYRDEPGALNEAFSDIMGTSVEARMARIVPMLGVNPPKARALQTSNRSAPPVAAARASSADTAMVSSRQQGMVRDASLSLTVRRRC